jgi:FkbM family methyltransferase
MDDTNKEFTNVELKYPFENIDIRLDPIYSTIVTTMCKNYSHRLDEWIQYNLKLGFSGIVVFDNEVDTTGLLHEPLDNCIIKSSVKEVCNKYKGKNVAIYPNAIGNAEVVTSFKVVKNAPAYSGLKNREYAIKNPDILEIQVTQVRLDNFFKDLNKLDFIKIDVEGGELNVIEGASELIKKLKPTLLFEFGKGSSEYYNSTPESMFDLLAQLNMNVYLLISYLKSPIPLNKIQFCQVYNERTEYYFVAIPK